MDDIRKRIEEFKQSLPTAGGVTKFYGDEAGRVNQQIERDRALKEIRKRFNEFNSMPAGIPVIQEYPNDDIRNRLEEFKASMEKPRPDAVTRAKPATEQQKVFDEYLMAQQEARERLLSELPGRAISGAIPGALGALGGYAAQYPGLPGDLLDVYGSLKPKSFGEVPQGLKEIFPTTERIQDYFIPEDVSPEMRAGLKAGNLVALGEGVAAIPGMVKGVAKGAPKVLGNLIDEILAPRVGAAGQRGAVGVRKGADAALTSDRALPLSLARATPKTQSKIDAFATRVARQMLGEHVRSGKPKDTQNLAGRSLKESERVKALDYVVEPTGAARESVIYQPRKGDVNIAIPGDQTISDSILRSVGDIEGIDSLQQGGAKYGLGKMDLADPLFWASGELPAQAAQNKINRIADFYNPERVVGQHLAMGSTSNNYAMHLADANLRAMDLSNMSQKQMNAFDNIIAYGYKHPATGEKIYFPEWPGIANPEDALQVMKYNPELRKHFNDRMKIPSITEPLGLPNGLDIQYAITEPQLRNMEINLTGLSSGEMVPGASLTDTAAHNTYNKGIRGIAKGHQEVLTPFELSFADSAQHIASTQRPQDFTGTIQKVFPHQIVDDQYLNEIGAYRDLIKKYTGKKSGGPVSQDAMNMAVMNQKVKKRGAGGVMRGGKVTKKADGGLTSDDLILEERGA